MDDVRYGHFSLDYKGNNVNEYCILYKNYAGKQCGAERSVAAYDPYSYGAGGWWRELDALLCGRTSGL